MRSLAAFVVRPLNRSAAGRSFRRASASRVPIRSRRLTKSNLIRGTGIFAKNCPYCPSRCSLYKPSFRTFLSRKHSSQLPYIAPELRRNTATIASRSSTHSTVSGVGQLLPDRLHLQQRSLYSTGNFPSELFSANSFLSEDHAVAWLE